MSGIGSVGLQNGMIPRITPPAGIPFKPPSLLWLAPALAADLMGRLGGNDFRDNQLAKIGKGYDPNTGLSKPYFGGQSLDRITEQTAPPFTGGQSTGVRYYINARVSQPTHGRTGEVINQPSSSAFGAITEARVGIDANGYASIIYSGRGSDGAIYNRTLPLSGLLPNIPFTVDFFEVVRGDGQSDTGGNISTPTTTRDGDTTTKGDDNPTDRTRKLGGAPPPAFSPNGTSTTTTNNSISNTTNNISNNATTNNNTTNNTTTSSATSTSPSTTVNNFNFIGDVNRSFSHAPPTTQPFTPPIVKPSIAPDPKPDKKEEERKVPPFIPPSPDKKIDDIAKDLAGLGAIIALIGANTQPSAQRINAKNGSCDALQSPSCREGLKNDIVNPINQKIDAKTGLLAANQAGQDIALGVIATEQQAQKGVLAAIALKAKDIFDLIGKLWNNSLVDKAMQYITMITVIHNAVMLSRGIGDTLGSALDSGLQAFGLQIKDKDGNQLGVTQITGKSFQDLIKSVIGAENYTTLNATWTQANRVYQAGINLLGNVQAIVDSSTAVAELCSNRVGTLMNALRSAGMVREDAYRGQSQNVTKFNAFQNKLEALEQGVSNTASIAGSVVSVQQSVNELKTNRAAFDNAVKGGDGRTQTATEEKREESVFKIADFTIVRPPEVTL